MPTKTARSSTPDIMKTDLRVVLMTAPTRELARHLATTAVGEKLAACVKLVPGVVSLYEWEGELTEAAEVMLVFKTTQARFPELRDRMLALHPHAVPEMVSLPADDGNVDYLDWVATATSEG